jgi:hypothetical protein
VSTPRVRGTPLESAALRAIWVHVSIRHAALGIGAALVLGLGVYLFVEVRAQPAPVVSSGSGTALPRTVAEPPPPAAAPPAPGPAPPPAARVLAGGPAPSTPTAGPAGSAAGSSAAFASPGPALATADPALTPDALDAAMSEANRAYDGGELDEAKRLASRVLAVQPTSVRMLRIMVSASCIEGDAAAALASFTKLPAPDQAQMRVRCARFSVTFPGP